MKLWQRENGKFVDFNDLTQVTDVDADEDADCLWVQYHLYYVEYLAQAHCSQYPSNIFSEIFETLAYLIYNPMYV